MKNLPLQNESFRYVVRSFHEWLDVLGYAPSTVYQLPNYINEFFYFLEAQGCQQITDIQISHFKAHFENLRSRQNTRRGGGLSNNYLNKHLQGLQKFTEYLRESGRLVLPALPIDWVSDDTRSIETINQEEIRELFTIAKQPMHFTGKSASFDGFYEAAAYRDVAMLTIFYSCGLRRNEGYSLDVSDINFDAQVLHVRKGKNYKERFVPFNKTASRYLQEWVYDWRPVMVKSKTENAFFISQRGTRMESQSMAIRLKLLQHKSQNTALQEKNLRLHVLRHSIATHLLQNGMPLAKISRFLGHTSLESTQVYTHLVQDKNEVPVQPFSHVKRYPYAKPHEDER